EASADQILLTELRANGPVPLTGRQLLSRIGHARVSLASHGLNRSSRVALLAANGIDWIAIDLAIMAEDLVVVPLYSRQSPSELVAMMQDSPPALICCGDAALRDAILAAWPEAPLSILFDDIFQPSAASEAPSEALKAVTTVPKRADSDCVAIIYTSGTSGEAKGVMITAGNVGHILNCTSERLDILMQNRPGQDRVYQWAPLNFAAAWI